MLRAIPMFLQPSGGELRSDFDDPAGWPQYVNIDLMRFTALELGDVRSGPMVFMVTKRPGSVPGLTDDLIEDKSQLAHFHRSDVFRMAIGDEPDQMNHAGRFMQAGDFFVMRASKRYTESTGLGEVRFLDVYADRRGVPATMADNKVHPAYDEDALKMNESFFVEAPAFHRSDDDAVTSLATSFAPIPSEGRLRATIGDPSIWTPLRDGSSVVVASIGDPTSGPLVILTRRPPGVVEPSATWGADVYRLVVAGSCRVGDIRLGTRQFRAIEAGIPEGEIVHGTEGSTQVLVASDRRHWRPESGGSADHLDQLAEVVDSTLGAIAA